MRDLTPITRQEPGVVLLENYDEVKAFLSEQLEHYRNVAYSENGLKDAKADRADLRKLKKAIADKRKDIKAVYMAPYLTVEEKLKELESLIQEPLDEIDAFIKQAESRAKEQKKDAIKEYYDLHSDSLGDIADLVFESGSFFDEKWTNASTGAAVWQREIQTKILDAAQNISVIRQTGGEFTPALISKYLESGNMDEVNNYLKALKKASNIGDIKLEDNDDNVVGYKIIRINGTARQMAQVIDQLDLMGVDYEEIEDGMPKEQEELLTPDFDSFVAFDIETTGSFGAASGDAPAEITEIGAVKVIDGKIVETADWLCNPGRKIVPQISRLTHITDDMVADKPPVSEIIKAFAEFAEDLPVVGHNIRSSDLHYISKAAKKAGVPFSNPFFDTYIYAKKFREVQGWDNVKLEYLSEVFGIEQNNAHRAYCDAEANVDVYFKLKEIGNEIGQIC